MDLHVTQRDEVYNICLQGWSSRGELLSCICFKFIYSISVWDMELTLQKGQRN